MSEPGAIPLIEDDIKALKRQLDEANATLAPLRESEALYRTLYNSSDEGFMEVEVVQDPDGQVVDWRYITLNPAVERLTGMKDIAGRLVSEVMPNLEREWAERYSHVVNTGEAIRFELPASELGLWFNAYLARIGPAGSRRVVVVFSDVTERKRAELTLQQSGERQAFLLRLSDSLRAEPTAEAIANRALRMLMEQMRLDRCYIGVYRLADDAGDFPYQVQDDRLPPLPAQVRLSDFPEALQVAFDRTLVIDDVVEMEGLSDTDRASFDGLGLRALISATLRKGENNPLWAINAISTGPRVWTRGEVALVEEVAERTWAAVERARAETALREGEERQAFLLTLSDALRPLADPAEVQAVAVRALGEHLGATRTQYWEVEPDGEYASSEGGYVGEGPRISGRVRLNDFGVHVIKALAAGETVAAGDVRADALASEEVAAAYDAVGVRAGLTVPLVKGGRMVALLGISHIETRDWTRQEIALAEDVAERTWAAVERARAEASLRASEGRYRELLNSIDEGFCVIEMIADDDGGFRDYRFLQTNPVFEAQAGLVDPIGRTAVELSPGLERWWMDTYGQVATTGKARRFEHGSEAMGRWFDVYAARVGEPDQLRVALLFRDISERKRAEGHRQLLIDELNHRVKNTLAIVQGLAQQTFRPGGDLLSARRAFELRLIALATAHDILTRENWASADLAELIRTTLAVHAGRDGRTAVEGPAVRLYPQTAVSITLALHELATNAVKYGALSIDAGLVEVRWTRDEDRLRLTWVERDGPHVEPPTHRGFGTRLIKRVFATELDVKVALDFLPGGLICRIDAHLPARSWGDPS